MLKLKRDIPERIRSARTIPLIASPATKPEASRMPFSFFFIKSDKIPPIAIGVERERGR